MAQIFSTNINGSRTLINVSINDASNTNGGGLAYSGISSSATVFNTSPTAGFEYRINTGPWKYLGRNTGSTENINFSIDTMYFRQTANDLSIPQAEISIDSSAVSPQFSVGAQGVLAGIKGPNTGVSGAAALNSADRTSKDVLRSDVVI